MSKRKTRVRREKIDFNCPVHLLDLVEDLSHQADMSRNDFIIQSIRIASPILAEKLGIEFDREDKVTYRERQNQGEKQ